MKSLICLWLLLSCIAIVLIVIDKLLMLLSQIPVSLHIFQHRKSTPSYDEDAVEDDVIEFSDDKVEAFKERIRELENMAWENVPDEIPQEDETGTEIILNSFELEFEKRYGE